MIGPRAGVIQGTGRLAAWLAGRARQREPAVVQSSCPRAQGIGRGGAIVDDDVVRGLQPGCPRSLCRHDTPDGRLRQPTAFLHPGDLRGRVAIDHADAVDPAAPAAGFDQQGHDENQVQAARLCGGLLGVQADQRVQQGFEAAARRGFAKHQVAHPGAIQRAVGGHRLRAEFARDGRHGRAAGRGQRMRNLVGIDDAGAPFGQHVGHPGLARTDAAGQSDLVHAHPQ